MESIHLNQKWRFWPILCLAFIYAFSNPLLMLATPIYFFQQGVQIKFISILSTALTVTYSISPIGLNKISDRLGRRKSVIISMIGATCAQLTFYITLAPIAFLIERLFEGFILGFFFPNLQASISDNQSIDHNIYLAKFNLSWSIAIVLGLLFGAILLQFTDNLQLLFYINPIFLAINAFIAILFFQEPINPNFEIQNSASDFNINHSEDIQTSITISNYYIPVIIPLLFILASSFASGNGTLLYPIRSEILGFHPSSTYFVNVFATLSQTLAMYVATLIALNKLKITAAFILIIYSFLFILFNLNEIYPLFIILFMFSGFFYGFLYGAASKLFLTLNIIKKTSKYSSISESSVGVTFFISQLFLGFMADINISLAYSMLSLTLIVIFLINLIFIRKFQEVEKV
ncbi:MAG: MFS transporter [Promethearchaeota archaeon]